MRTLLLRFYAFWPKALPNEECQGKEKKIKALLEEFWEKRKIYADRDTLWRHVGLHRKDDIVFLFDLADLKEMHPRATHNPLRKSHRPYSLTIPLPTY
jgi:hypothetical protein